MAKYHIAIRVHAMNLVKDFGVVSTAKRMCISRTTLWRWKKFGIGSIKQKPRKGMFEKAREFVTNFLRTTPCVNGMIIQKALIEGGLPKISTKTIFRYIKALGLSRKRVVSRGTSVHATPERIESFKIAYKDAVASGKVLVSVDECGFSERVKSLYGYSKRGEPCIVKNSGSWKNTSLLLAVFSTGEKRYFLFDKAVNKQAFAAFLEHMALDDHHVVIADNASIHKKLTLRKSKATILYTPPYTPESNPVELCFARAKRIFRSLNVMIRPDVTAIASESVERGVTDSLIRECFDHVLRTFVYKETA